MPATRRLWSGDEQCRCGQLEAERFTGQGWWWNKHSSGVFRLILRHDVPQDALAQALGVLLAELLLPRDASQEEVRLSIAPAPTSG